jgi:hypothetical protein
MPNEKTAREWLKEGKATRRVPVTMSRITALAMESHVGLTNPGICCYCGNEADGCEPDACNYHCDVCGNNAVFGAEELVMEFAG